VRYISLLLAGIMMLAVSAQAQYGRGRHGGGHPGFGLVDRALADLNAADRRTEGREGTFDQARRDLRIFREHLAEGRFDKDRLDGAIENLSRLSHSDRVHHRDRRILEDDANALRDLRERYNERRERWR
jgi:hypothetical protein